MKPTSENTAERLRLIDQLKTFLMTAPKDQQVAIKRHSLPSNESISCVKWNDAFYISGTDIVRSLVFRFQAFGRPIKYLKKFEEGIFSDLRNLKPGTDAILEGPKSPFLDLLFQNSCIRTQKKQKVFYWDSVPHDRLFLDALERDLKREKMGIEPTTVAVAQPALTISLDTTQAMFDNVRKTVLSELNIGSFCIHYHEKTASSSEIPDDICSSTLDSSASSDTDKTNDTTLDLTDSSRKDDLQKASPASTIFGRFSLFEGSPTYKQRRRRVTITNQQQQQQQQITHPVGIHSRVNHLENSPSLSIDMNNNGNINHSVNRNNPDNNILRNESYSYNNNNADDDTSIITTRYFNCPLSTCDKHFKRLEHMKRHLRTHTMERPYTCDMCGKRFSRSDNLAQHKKTHERNKAGKTFGWEPSSSSSREKSMKKISNSNKTLGGVRASGNSIGGYLSQSINKSFPTRTRNTSGGSNYSNGSNSSPYSNRSISRSSSATSRRSSVPSAINSGRVAGRNRTIRRTTHQRRQSTYPTRSRIGTDVETEAIYESDWTQRHNNIEYLKVDTKYPEQLLQPELSISTTSSSTVSSCDTSPTCTQLPTIKIEDLEPYSDIPHQNQMEDTAMMMVEEFVPQQQQYYWEDESASDWQRRVDWNQYSSPVESEKYDTEDMMVDQQESISSFPSYYFLSQPSPYSHYDVSNTSSCLASPTMLPAFLIKTTTTSTSNSTVTTAVNSPIMRSSEFNATSHYFSDESPTITPSDALLQRH